MEKPDIFTSCVDSSSLPPSLTSLSEYTVATKPYIQLFRQLLKLTILVCLFLTVNCCVAAAAAAELPPVLFYIFLTSSLSSLLFEFEITDQLLAERVCTFASGQHTYCTWGKASMNWKIKEQKIFSTILYITY